VKSIGLCIAVAASLVCGHAEARVTALVGATVIDVSKHGSAGHDIANAVVLLDGKTISAVGAKGQVPIPAGAEIVDLSGKFIIPGLVDGFCGMQNQAEANAELYEGVTTIVGSGDDRRGTLYFAADPSPHVYPADGAGTTDDWDLLRSDPAWRDRLADGDAQHELTPQETDAQLAETARRGTRVIWVGHNITPDNAKALIATSRRLHLVTYGEFIATPYRIGIEAGVSSLLHMTRIELGLASPDAIAKAAADPDGPAARAAYKSVDKIDPADPAVARYGDLLAAHNTAIMPTFSLFYAVLPGHRNLWREPAAALLDPKAIGITTDPATGELYYPNPKLRPILEAIATHSWAIDKVLIAHHAPVLAASGATWQGSLPGISMHTELEMLVRAGLSPREALAAATGNYAEQFGWAELGAIEPGRRADLVVLEQDPTKDVANADRIAAVYLAGAKLDRAALLKRAPN
jgi:imidazolonepropionase-like amidohydrolase